MNSDFLIQELVEQTRQIINQVEKLKNSDLNALTWKASPNSWSILQCLEHLNLYGDFYLPQIENKLNNSKTKYELDFMPGLLGNYFAKSMLPKGKMLRMKTFKDKNPLGTKLNKTAINRCIDQQIKLLDLLNQSRNVSLNKVKIQTSISGLIRLKLGDTFRFLINHNIRHLNQIESIKANRKIV